MSLRFLAALALVPLTAMPVLAQQAEPAPTPVPAVRIVPQATDANVKTQPQMTTPARKSNCPYGKQVSS